MTNRESNSSGLAPEYECIEPELGAELWRLDDSETSAAMMERLQTHVEWCAHCRTLRMMQDGVAQGMAAGTLTVDATGSRRQRHLVRNSLVWSGITAIAASLALVFLQLPGSYQDGMTIRGEAELAIVRPVPDEIIWGSQPVISWQSVDGANSYQVRVSAVDSEYIFSTSVIKPEVKIPREAALPAGTRFRVQVRPQPTHLAAPTGLYSSFITGSWRDFAAYRWQLRSTTSRAIGWLGFGSLLAGVLVLFVTKTRR